MHNFSKFIRSSITVLFAFSMFGACVSSSGDSEKEDPVEDVQDPATNGEPSTNDDDEEQTSEDDIFALGNNSCKFAHNDRCDEKDNKCAEGTDTTDCLKEAEDDVQEREDDIDVEDDDSCDEANNCLCDDDICIEGTDTTDCNLTEEEKESCVPK